jgi:hypothetical protein
MIRIGLKQQLYCLSVRSAARMSSVVFHNDPTSPTPLVEHYRSSWPDPVPDRPSSSVASLPPRTVPDSKLRFSFTAHFSSGGSFFYPHLKTNPADFKVSMKVLLADLPFEGDERAIFTRMVGSRLNHGKQELTLTAEVFPNRMENRKYLLVQLERLLAEAKELGAVSGQYVE